MTISHYEPLDSELKILIVDDSATDRAIFRRYLAQSDAPGFVFFEAESLEEASALIAREMPDCVLLDYNLPDGTGTELIARLAGEFGRNRLPIVMLSGSGTLEIAIEAMRSGAHDYLVKSHATPAELLRAVRNAIDKVGLIREKDAAWEKIRSSEERYRLLFDNTPLPALVFDRETLQVLAVNDSAVRHYGYERAEFLAMRLDALDALESESDAAALAQFCDDGGLVRSIAARHRKKDGAAIDVEVSCHDITFRGRDARFVIVQDITARRAQEHKIRESEEFNRTLIESSPDCVKLLSRDGRVEFMNRNGLCLMEVDDFSVLRDRPWHELWTDECRDVVKQTLELVKAGEIGRFQGFCPTAKGKPKWWDVIVTPVRNHDGEVEKILSVSRDITPSKIIEREREENLRREKNLREQAESANRAKDEFLAVISHELRSPLNAMYGWSKMLKRGVLDDDSQKQAIAVIDRNIELQNHLIEDLLDISRIISGKLSLVREEIDFRQTVGEAVETARLAARGNDIELNFRPAVAACRGSADLPRFLQIVGNLLNNAVKFTPEGGRIDVALECRDGRATITVADTGMGIEPEFLPFIFDRFKQADGSTRRKFSGLGLGLAIVKSLVELHGGTIAAASEGAGRGAKFTVELPLAEKSAPARSHARRGAAAGASGARQLENLRIVVVEDETDSIELMRFVLESNGAEVHAFDRAEDALENIERIEPHLLISDISMAETDGFDLIGRVRNSDSPRVRALPAIAVTAHTSVTDRNQILAAGFHLHIGKPFDVEEIPRLIRKLMTEKRRQRSAV